MGTTSLIGREQAIGEVADMLTSGPGGRLVTLTGPGGVGKTRLALAVGARLHDRFGAGLVFVPLATVTDAQLVLAGIGRALGTDLAVAGSPLGALAERLGDDTWLLILDNLEQVVEVARDLSELLTRCPGVTILATSRTVLGLRAERRLRAEAGNLAAAVGWYFSHDRAPLPHLFRDLLNFWVLTDDILSLARGWIGQLLPAADSLDPQARAELLWADAVTANQAGDGAAALAASQRLGLLLPEIEDPHLRAVSRLAMSWASMIVSDHDGALRQASVALTELRRQDEPYWTAVAVLTVGYIERDAGRYDDAFAHLSQAHELAERFGYSWLDTYTRVLLGTLAVLRGRLDEARAVLDQELAASLPAYNIINITLALAAFAQLAFAEGNPERAALLTGAIDGLRQRAGLGVWPAPRRGETDLAAEIRQVLGTGRFDQLYAAGARLSRREAAAARDQRTGTPAS